LLRFEPRSSKQAIPESKALQTTQTVAWINITERRMLPMSMYGYSLADAFFRVTELVPHKIAIEDRGKTYRFFEIKTRVLKWVKLFQQRGFQKGDRIAVYSDNNHYFLEVF